MTDLWPDLDDGEVEIDIPNPDVNERCLRNVHPTHIHNGVLSSQVFTPSERDAGKRSTARNSLVSPKEHFEEFKSLGNDSEGVWAVDPTVIQNSDLRWVDDSESVTNPPAIKGHAYIDFRAPGMSRGKIKRSAREISRAATRSHPD